MSGREPTGSSPWPTTSGPPTCATRSPRAPRRRSSSSSTRSGSQPGSRVLDVGCGPGRHARALAERGHRGARHRHLAAVRRPGRRGRAAGARRSSGSTPARLPFDAEFDAAISLCQGAFGLVGGPGSGVDDDVACCAGMARRCGPAGASRCRRSPPTSRCATSRTRTPSTPTPASTTSAPRSATRTAERCRGRPVDDVLHAPRAAPAGRGRRPRGRRGSGRSTPGRYGRTPPDLEHAEFLVIATKPGGSLVRALSDPRARLAYGRTGAIPRMPASPLRQDPESESVSDQQPAVPSDPAPAAASPDSAATSTSEPPVPRHRPDNVRPTASRAVPGTSTTVPLAPSTRKATYTPRQVVDDDLAACRSTTPSTHDRRGRGRPDRQRHGRQDRQGRGAARHRLQVRGRHPGPRAVDPQRRRPARDRVARRGDRGPRPPEGGQGRPPRPVQEAGAVRAGLGHDREDQGSRRRRRGPGHRGRQGRPHPRHRPARLPARRRSSSCAGCATCSPTSAGRSRPRSSSSTRTATTSCCPAAPTSRRRRRSSATSSSPT